MALTFCNKYEATNFVFQESQLLNIITDYSQNIYYKLFYCISFCNGKEYI